MRVRSSFFAAALFLFNTPALLPAQSVGKMLNTDLQNFTGDVLAVWSSPFRATGRDWLAAGAIIGLSAAVSPLDDNVDRWMVDTRDASGWNVLDPLSEGGVLFSGKYVTPVAAGALLYGLATKNTKLQEGLFGCLAAYASSSAVRTFVVYPLVARERPDPTRDSLDTPAAAQGDQYNFDFPGKFKEWGMHSLPAGHATNVMACATFLNTRFDLGLVEPVLYAVAGGVAVGRLHDRRHWTSDTFLGVGFGYAVGRVLAQRSADRAPRGAGARAALSNVYVTPSTKGVTFGWKATF